MPSLLFNFFLIKTEPEKLILLKPVLIHFNTSIHLHLNRLRRNAPFSFRRRAGDEVLRRRAGDEVLE